jgi:hypothetical protein
VTDTEDFRSYARLADQLIERATKDQLADVARLVAINIGWYQVRFGDVPQDIVLKMASLARDFARNCAGPRRPEDDIIRVDLIDHSRQHVGLRMACAGAVTLHRHARTLGTKRRTRRIHHDD